MVDFVTPIINALAQFAPALATAIGDFFKTLMIDDTDPLNPALTDFAYFILTFVGIGVAFGIFKFVVGLVRAIMRRKG